MVQQPDDYKATGKSDEIFSPSAALQGGGLQEAKHNKKVKKSEEKSSRYLKKWNQEICEILRSVAVVDLGNMGLYMKSHSSFNRWLNLHEFRWTNNVLFCFVQSFYEIRNAVLEI